jgi:DNA-binding YbaB/EbfC family protein
VKFRGGMGELMRQASRMQRKIEKRREELKDETFDAEAGNEMVKATVNGAGDLVRIEIKEGALEEEGLEMVTDLIVAASNKALADAREHVDAELEKVTGGLKIPGIG